MEVFSIVLHPLQKYPKRYRNIAKPIIGSSGMLVGEGVPDVPLNYEPFTKTPPDPLLGPASRASPFIFFDVPCRGRRPRRPVYFFYLFQKECLK